MATRKDIIFSLFIILAQFSSPLTSFAQDNRPRELRFVQIAAKNKIDRSKIADLGVSIEALRSDSIWGFASPSVLTEVKNAGLKVMSDHDVSVGRGGHQSLFDFPTDDSRFHNYSEATSALKSLASKYSDIAKLHSIGKSIEGRDVWAMNINSSPEDLTVGSSNKPGAIFMGNHHAREHLSLEIPLMLIEYLLKNREDSQISKLLTHRDIWIIPMVNPDGVEFDIATNEYRMWRKNRRNNGDGTYGVDLNRNYGYQWGSGGSSTNTSSEVYMGTAPFSEPETQIVREFVKNHLNANVLLSFHTFSELILYPWGYKYDAIDNEKDKQVYKTMAATMSNWNKYTPQQSSELYIASGDTTDWAYGEYGIFSFTFELSPKSMWSGGFYPGAKVIDKVFEDNIKPCLYLIDLADDPYRALGTRPSGMLRHYVQPEISPSTQWEVAPFRNR